MLIMESALIEIVDWSDFEREKSDFLRPESLTLCCREENVLVSHSSGQDESEQLSRTKAH